MDTNAHNKDVFEYVTEYRQKPILGNFVALIPATPEYARDIVELRNTDRVSYYLNLKAASTIDGQLKWF